MKMAESFRNRWKTLSAKEKLLVTSNFSFAHSVRKRLVLQTGENQDLFRKGLNPKPHVKLLSFSKSKAFADALYKHFLLFSHCLLPDQRQREELILLH